MHEETVRWRAQLARVALENLDAHDKERRRLLDERSLDTDWQALAVKRIDLAAQVAEASRALVKVVLG